MVGTVRIKPRLVCDFVRRILAYLQETLRGCCCTDSYSCYRIIWRGARQGCSQGNQRQGECESRGVKARKLCLAKEGSEEV